MRRKTKLGLLVYFAVALASATMFNQAYAQTVDDATTTIVLVAAFVGGLAAPIFGYATAQADAQKVKKFNWSQYSIAVIVVIPGVLALTLLELQVYQLPPVMDLYTTLVVFVSIFTKALAVDYGKSRWKKSTVNT